MTEYLKIWNMPLLQESVELLPLRSRTGRQASASPHTHESETVTWSFPQPSAWTKSLELCFSQSALRQMGSHHYNPPRWDDIVRHSAKTCVRHPVLFSSQFCWLRAPGKGSLFWFPIVSCYTSSFDLAWDAVYTSGSSSNSLWHRIVFYVLFWSLISRGGQFSDKRFGFVLVFSFSLLSDACVMYRPSPVKTVWNGSPGWAMMQFPDLGSLVCFLPPLCLYHEA